MDIVVRQAHPGPGARPYREFSEKMQDAERYQREEQIPWKILVDDVSGTTHQVYGALSDPTYLLDSDGRVAYYNLWTHVPTLGSALESLMAQGGRGAVHSGPDRTPHMLSGIVGGWRGLQRGLPQSYTDLETAMPGMAAGIALGHLARPLLAPVALRDKPWPAGAKLALAVVAAGLVAFVLLPKRTSEGDRRALPRS